VIFHGSQLARLIFKKCGKPQTQGGNKNTNGNIRLKNVPIHFWFARRHSSVPDYGYSSRQIHPVSPTIFLCPELSCNTCYSITFQLFVRRFQRIVFPNEVPSQATIFFTSFYKPIIDEKLLLIRESFRFQCDVYETKVPFRLLLFLNQH